MRFLLSIAFLTYCFASAAQKNFEGIIIYKGYSVPYKDTTGSEHLFGKTKASFNHWVIKDGKKIEEEQKLIYDFGKGIVMQIDHKSKIVTIDTVYFSGNTKSAMKPPERTSERETILSYPCVKYKDPPGEFENAETWYSDSLVYIVPKQFHTSDIDSNLLWLKMKMVFDLRGFMGDSSAVENPVVVMTADNIIHRELPDSLFDLPSSYKKFYNRISTEDKIEIKDIEITETENMEIPPPPPPAPPKPSQQKPRTKIK